MCVSHCYDCSHKCCKYCIIDIREKKYPSFWYTHVGILFSFTCMSVSFKVCSYFSLMLCMLLFVYSLKAVCLFFNYYYFFSLANHKEFFLMFIICTFTQCCFVYIKFLQIWISNERYFYMKDSFHPPSIAFITENHSLTFTWHKTQQSEFVDVILLTACTELFSYIQSDNCVCFISLCGEAREDSNSRHESLQ